MLSELAHLVVLGQVKLVGRHLIAKFGTNCVEVRLISTNRDNIGALCHKL